MYKCLDKTQTIIRCIADEMTVLQEYLKHGGNGPRSREEIDHKASDSDLVFVMYVSQTYVRPFGAARVFCMVPPHL
jgi:hypothetical protein